jgi:hypothetical protein
VDGPGLQHDILHGVQQMTWPAGHMKKAHVGFLQVEQR